MSFTTKRHATAPQGAVAAALAAVLAIAAGFAVASPVGIDAPRVESATDIAQSNFEHSDDTQQTDRNATQAAFTQVEGPSLRAESIAHDWGTVELGTQIRHRFLVRNEGDAPARLVRSRSLRRNLNVKHDEEIPAGGIGEVEVTLPTDQMSEGRAQIALQFDTNTPKPFLLLLQGELVASVR